MITVNNKKCEWNAGLTAGSLRDMLKDSGELKSAQPKDTNVKSSFIIIINGIVVSPDECQYRLVADGDYILIVPIFAGG